MAHVKFNSGRNEWYSPGHIIDAARQVMGSIDTDPASSAIANETVGAAVYFTKEDNGLIQQWYGNTWLNPPYSQPLIRQFTDALVEKFKGGEIAQAITLTNNASETKWAQTLFSVASAACFPRGRIRFLDPEGKPSGAPLQGQMICYFGPNRERFKEVFAQFGLVLLAREQRATA